MKNSAGKFFITGGGRDVTATFISFEIIKRLLYLYSEIPQKPTFHQNLRRANVYEANAKNTDRFSHTYFQNCVREWNQLDESNKSSPTVSVFKRELMCLIRPPKRSMFSFLDIEGVRPLTHLQLEFCDLREHRFRHNFQCPSPMCFCQTGIENNKHFLLHCPCHSSHCRDLLDRMSNVVDVDPENLPKQTFVICYYLVIPVSWLILTITSLNQQYFFQSQLRVSRRSRQIIKQLVTTFNDSGYSFYLLLFCIAFSFHVPFHVSLVNKSCC